MKRSFILLGAALAALAACNKVETVTIEAPGEMAFHVAANKATKGAELTGTLMPKEWGIYAAATQKSAAGLLENPNFFTGTEKMFSTNEADPTGTDSRLWRAYPSIYWPIGGVRMDFLAYAMPRTDHNDIASSADAAADWTAFWNETETDAASRLSFNGVDTYANQVDVLYGVANDQTSAANGGSSGSTAIAFNHAQALLIFNIRQQKAIAEPDFVNIREIGFYTEDRVKKVREEQVLLAAGNASSLTALADEDVTLKTVGTFTVDNSRNNLLASWSALESRKENYKMPNFTDSTPKISASNSVDSGSSEAIKYGVAFTTQSEYAQLGETLLIPEQPKVNFTITYTLGGKTYFYTYNDLRGMWEKGKKYIYNLDLVVDEVVITESVSDYVESTHVAGL